ncbi:MAG: glycosyltransferase, partial [Verrucomicrobiota bacterium]
QSILAGMEEFELILVGNDDGELSQLRDLTAPNITLKEPVFGEEKRVLFETCHFFALPSESEGFPVALLEGMAHGLIPMITDGCNLPEATTEGLAIGIEPTLSSITEGLETIRQMSSVEISERRSASRDFVEKRYSPPVIAAQHAALYHELLAT